MRDDQCLSLRRSFKSKEVQKADPPPPNAKNQGVRFLHFLDTNSFNLIVFLMGDLANSTNIDIHFDTFCNINHLSCFHQCYHAGVRLDIKQLCSSVVVGQFIQIILYFLNVFWNLGSSTTFGEVYWGWCGMWYLWQLLSLTDFLHLLSVAGIQMCCKFPYLMNN